MTLVDDIKPVLYDVRGLLGELGLRPYSVAVEITTWSGAVIGQGVETTDSTPIVEANNQPPKVRWLSDEEVALLGIGDAVLEVGPITPDFVGGGTSWATITAASAPQNAVVRYRVVGPEFPSGALFERVGGDSQRPFGYKLRLRRVAS